MSLQLEKGRTIGRFLIAVGALFAGLAVVLGAFGAHGLANSLSARELAVWQTGVQYQMFHSIALMGVGILLWIWQTRRTLFYAGYAFLVGILLFSGSLYAIAFFKLTNVGIITPIGGLFFIVGWILLLWSAVTTPICTE